MRTLQLIVVLAVIVTPTAAATELHMCEGALLGRVCEEPRPEFPRIDPEDPLPMPQVPGDPEVPELPSGPDDLPTVDDVPDLSDLLPAPVVPGIPSIELPELPTPGELEVLDPEDIRIDEPDPMALLCKRMPQQFPVLGQEEPVENVHPERICGDR